MSGFPRDRRQLLPAPRRYQSRRRQTLVANDSLLSFYIRLRRGCRHIQSITPSTRLPNDVRLPDGNANGTDRQFLARSVVIAAIATSHGLQIASARSRGLILIAHHCIRAPFEVSAGATRRAK